MISKTPPLLSLLFYTPAVMDFHFLVVEKLWKINAGKEGAPCNIVIPHLETRACDWSNSRHMTFTKSGYFPHEAILPPLQVNIASTDQYCLHIQFDFSKQQLEPLD